MLDSWRDNDPIAGVEGCADLARISVVIQRVVLFYNKVRIQQFQTCGQSFGLAVEEQQPTLRRPFKHGGRIRNVGTSRETYRSVALSSQALAFRDGPRARPFGCVSNSLQRLAEYR